MRFPIIRQHDSTDCGPAALAMMAAYHRKRIPIARLRQLAGTDISGTTLSGLITAAQAVGFEARAFEATPGAVARVQFKLPVIAHWNENNRKHYVVLYNIGRKKSVWIADPAKGRRKLSELEFERYWTGTFLILTPTHDLKDVMSASSSLAKLRAIIRPHRHLFLDALLAAVLMTILGLVSSFYIQVLVDYVFIAGQSSALAWFGAGMLLLALARAAFLAIRTYTLARLSPAIDADTVLGYHNHLLRLPLTFFTSRRTGEILSRVNDCVKIRNAIGTAMLGLIVDSLLMTLSAGFMLWLSWHAIWGALAVAVISAATVRALGKEMRVYQHLAMEKAAEVEATMLEDIAAIQTLKALRAERASAARLKSRFTAMVDAAYQSQKLANLSTAMTYAVSALTSVGLLIAGGRLVLSQSLSVGQLMSLYVMLGMFLAPLERLASSVQTIEDAVVASERLGEVLELQTEAREQRPNAIDRPIDGSVEFRNVFFRYRQGRRVLENISLKFAAGECVGVMGESGCGKTTLVNLLGRFYEPTDGEIRIDDIDIRDYTIDCIRREIGFVPQDIVLFHGTIAENIRMGKPDASDHELIQAAKAARVHLIAPLFTMVGERGQSLSGGERQRVAIARAILQDPAILVMDEPTSHLDAESEAAVEALLNKRRGKRTTIVISHRPLQTDRLIELPGKVE